LTLRILSDDIDGVPLRWSRSATRHRVPRAATRFVIEHAGLVFVQPAAPPERPEDRLVWLGDDQTGRELEVMGVRVEDGSVLVIHAMPLRPQFRAAYEEATTWRM
jgi:hypothetical protein